MSMYEILTLAALAHRRGLDTPERVVGHLERLIVRNAAYVARRQARGRSTSFDSLVEEDNQAIAVAIVLIESLSDMASPGSEEEPPS